MKKGVDFLVVGSSTLDVIAKTRDVERIDIGGKHVERLVCISFASKSELENVEIHPGGSAANPAVMMRVLGSSVRLLSAVGNDSFGRIVLEDLRKNAVSTDSVCVVKGSQTGVGLSILSGGEKSMLVFKGANEFLGPENVSGQIVDGARNVFVTSLVSQKNFALFVKLVRLARQRKAPVVFAPSITMLHRWLPNLKRLGQFDVVIMNFEEASYFTGKSLIKEILSSLPGKVCVVTRDVEGAYVRANGRFFHIGAVQVKVIDTTGAGDAFAGAFAASFCLGKSVESALKVAVSAAAMKLTHKGAHFSMKASALSRFMKGKDLAVRRI